MIYKIIHDRFELDLIDKEVDTTQENFWFDKNFNLQYSLPFDILLTEQLDASLGHISNINSKSAVQFLNVKLYRYDQKYDAKLIVDSFEKNRVSFSLEFGFEQFPGFDKKLKELPLEETVYPENNLQSHALSIYDKTWPDVNYNFHQIIVPEDALSENETQWENFEGFINKFKDGAFVENTFDSTNNIAFNRNIMQPQPYLLHVLQKGFESAGFTLAGDILQDPEYKKTTINLFSKYYSNINSRSDEFIKYTYHLQDVSSPVDHGEDTLQYLVPGPGVYKIVGNATLRTKGPTDGFANIEITYNNTVLFEDAISNNKFQQKFIDIDVTLKIEDDSPLTLIQFYFFNLKRYDSNGETFQDLNILDVTITRITELDSNGNVIPSLVQPSKIKLTECVPNKNFGDLVKAVVKHRNYSLDVKNNNVFMNKVVKNLATPPLQDLSSTEVQFPTIENKPLESYLLKFQRTPEDYEYDEIFVDQSGSFTDDFEKKDNTKRIQIDLLPLQRRLEQDIQTVRLPDDNQKNIYISLYDGTLNADNKAENELKLLLPYSYSEYYGPWLQFLINAKIIKWSNLMPVDQAYALDVYKKSFAYQAKLILKKIVSTNVTRDYVKIDFEAYT